MIKIFFVLLILGSYAETSNEMLNRLKKNIPNEAKGIVERIVWCNHWTGEDGYSADRRRKIVEEIKKLKCEKLEVDKARVLKEINPKEKEKVKNAFSRASKTVF